VTGRVTLSGPAPRGGLGVELVTSDPAATLTPSIVRIPWNQSTGNFTLKVPAGFSGTLDVVARTNGEEQKESFSVTEGHPLWGCESPARYAAYLPRWALESAMGKVWGLNRYGEPLVTIEQAPLDTPFEEYLRGGTTALNVHGQSVGVSWSDKRALSGFIASAPTEEEPARLTSYPDVYFTALNDEGVAVGYRDLSAKELGNMALRVTRDGEQELGTLGGPSSIARAIDSWGRVVGVSTNGDGAEQAFVFVDDKMEPLPLPKARSSTAVAINDSGLVTGTYVDEDGLSHAYLYALDTGELVEVASFSDYRHSVAAGVNDSGLVVGTLYRESPADPQGAVPFVYSKQSGFQALVDMVEPTDGVEIQQALAINDAGQILVSGLIQGEPARFLLVPPAVK
jgi:probable HAF family extracellular repeat protein